MILPIRCNQTPAKTNISNASKEQKGKDKSDFVEL
jgi:hypothetical protein